MKGIAAFMHYVVRVPEGIFLDEELAYLMSKIKKLTTKKSATLKFKLASLSDLKRGQFAELPEGLEVQVLQEYQGHKRVAVVGWIWDGSLEDNEPAPQKSAGSAHRKTNKAGQELIKEFEGLRLQAYMCSSDVPTIGWGTTRINGAPVTLGMEITREQAQQYFEQDLVKFERGVSQRVKAPLTDNQFSALVSLCYNCGFAPLKENNSIQRAFRQHPVNYDAAAMAFLLWNKSDGKVSDGLVRRRHAEKKLFES